LPHRVEAAKRTRLERIVRPLKPVVLADTRSSREAPCLPREPVTGRRHNGFELCRSLGEGGSDAKAETRKIS
jgi:hypothetical protein